MAKAQEGGCLCGAVRYRVEGPLRPVTVCHCGQCRRTHGHAAAYTAAPKAALTLVEASGLRWYESSPGVRRGFCGGCGASLFWERTDGPKVSIAAGTLDGPDRPQDRRPHLRRRRRRLLTASTTACPVPGRRRGRAQLSLATGRARPIAASVSAASRATSSAADCRRASRSALAGPERQELGPALPAAAPQRPGQAVLQRKGEDRLGRVRPLDLGHEPVDDAAGGAAGEGAGEPRVLARAPRGSPPCRRRGCRPRRRSGTPCPSGPRRAPSASAAATPRPSMIPPDGDDRHAHRVGDLRHQRHRADHARLEVGAAKRAAVPAGLAPLRDHGVDAGAAPAPPPPPRSSRCR